MVRKVIVLAGALSLLVLAQADGAGAAARHVAVAKVNVTFTDTALRVTPTTPSSGRTTFDVVNKGKKPHTLLVKGPGVGGTQTPKLQPGGRANVTVTLRPGVYALSDPIGLGEYNVFFLDVIHNTSLTANGDGSVVRPDAPLPPMCGAYYTP